LRADCLAAQAVGNSRSQTAEICDSESIEVDVVDDFTEVVALPPPRVADRTEVTFDKDRFISAAEQMAPESIAGIDASGEGILKPGHALDKVGSGRFEKLIVVIIH